MELGGEQVEVIVTRKFSKRDDGNTDTSVVVEQSKDARFTSPQKLLDSSLGALRFDPLAFAGIDRTSRADHCFLCSSSFLRHSFAFSVLSQLS